MKRFWIITLTTLGLAITIALIGIDSWAPDHPSVIPPVMPTPTPVR